MHISIATNSILSYPLIQKLIQNENQLEIFIPQKESAFARQLTSLINKESITFVDEKAKMQLPVSSKTELLLSFGYPYKITSLPAQLTALNIHFGSLPENKGPDPVFWTLKKGKSIAHLAIHKISEELDSGDVLLEKKFDIIPGENYGLLNARLATLSVSIIEEVIQKLPEAKPQSKERSQYYKRPEIHDLTIAWNNMNALEIENLINACNPKYGGAMTRFNGADIRILEVTPVDSSSLTEEQKKNKAGTIVHANPNYGLFVLTKEQQCLRINIVSMNEGVFSGNKLVSMGLRVGTNFS